MNRAILRSRVQHIARFVQFDLNDGVGLAEIEYGRHQVVQFAVRQIDSFGLRAEPARLVLIEELVQTAVFGAHEYASSCLGRAYDVYYAVVCLY